MSAEYPTTEAINGMSELHLGAALQACSEQVARMKAAQVCSMLNPIFWTESFLVRAQNNK